MLKSKALINGICVCVCIKQESLSAVLENRGWFSEREDFSVMLQARPVHTDLSAPVSMLHSQISVKILKI